MRVIHSAPHFFLPPFDIELPKLTVVTGKNGVGKTHFVRLFNNMGQINVTDPEISSQEIVNIGDELYAPGDSQLSYGYDDYRAEFEKSRDPVPSVLSSFIRTGTAVEDVARPVIIKAIENVQDQLRTNFNIQVTRDNLDETLQANPLLSLYILPKVLFDGNLSRLFYIHHLLRVQERVDEAIGRPRSDVNALARLVFSLRTPPWEVLQEAIDQLHLPYTVIPPSGDPYRLTYKVELEHKTSGATISIDSLSSGEKVLFKLALSQFNSISPLVTPRLLALDEPDAHLHPELTKFMFDILANLFVDRYGMHVILTTHSPSTVALAPPDSVFRMSRGSPFLERVSTRKAVSDLSVGLIVVGPDTRYVWVEAQPDAEFYERLFRYGSPQLFPDLPSMVFLPASPPKTSAGSTRTTQTKDSGGRDKVWNLTRQLNISGIVNQIHGIVDGDGDWNNSGPNEAELVHRLDRYSPESYFYDPINIFGFLLESGKLPDEHSFGLDRAEAYRIRDFSTETLQQVLDFITDHLERGLGPTTVGADGHREIEIAIKGTDGFFHWHRLSYKEW